MTELRQIRPQKETVQESFFPSLKAQPEVPAMPGSQPEPVPSQQGSAPVQASGLLQAEQQEGPWSQAALAWLEPQARWGQAQPAEPEEGVARERGRVNPLPHPVPGEQGEPAASGQGEGSQPKALTLSKPGGPWKQAEPAEPIRKDRHGQETLIPEKH